MIAYIIVFVVVLGIVITFNHNASDKIDQE
jgi:hypothetical protein